VTLVYRWFFEFDETATIAVNFAGSSLVLIPLAAFTTGFGLALHAPEPPTVAVLLLLLGTLAGSAAGRVCYQMALTATEDDNGYVTVLFLLIRALSSLISFMLSWWILGLQFVPSAMFFIGLALVTISLLMLRLASWRKSKHNNSPYAANIQGAEPAADYRCQLVAHDSIPSSARGFDDRLQRDA
jgi:drug/metabolite transporter (DMT)-like permease